MNTVNIIRVNDSVSLELMHPDHASGLFKIIDGDRAYLKEWLSWLDDIRSVDDFSDFIQRAGQRYIDRREISFTINYNNRYVGRIGLYGIDHYNRLASIGYWIGEAFQGKGIMIAACKAIVDYGFDKLNLNRIEIKCGTGNIKSQKIPERLGFTKEGITRQGETMNGKAIDLNVYSILRHEWNRADPGHPRS
ncbi:MAG TPA: GNAT family protein [Flavisolibacter sp.]|nr:GNAT family protein [Flavisolibacter sp.]